MGKKAWMVEKWIEDGGKWTIYDRRYYASDAKIEVARKEGRLTPESDKHLIEVYELKESYRYTVPYTEPIEREIVDVDTVDARV